MNKKAMQSLAFLNLTQRYVQKKNTQKQKHEFYHLIYNMNKK